MTAEDHPAGRQLLGCVLCATPPNPVARVKLPIAGGLLACPYCDPNLFTTKTRRTR